MNPGHEMPVRSGRPETLEPYDLWYESVQQSFKKKQDFTTTSQQFVLTLGNLPRAYTSLSSYLPNCPGSPLCPSSGQPQKSYCALANFEFKVPAIAGALLHSDTLISHFHQFCTVTVLGNITLGRTSLISLATCTALLRNWRLPLGTALPNWAPCDTGRVISSREHNIQTVHTLHTENHIMGSHIPRKPHPSQTLFGYNM